MRGKGLTISPDTLRLADNAALILPSHGALERAREERRGEKRFGTTGRGIGPAYEDKVGRRAVRVCDLVRPGGARGPGRRSAAASITRCCAGSTRRNSTAASCSPGCARSRPKCCPMPRRCGGCSTTPRRAGRRILFEGAQGAMLDVDHGTYPYVTSSNTVAGQAAAGSGIAPSAIGFVLGITKAYTTRVGAGPFPTELTDAVGQTLGERGREFGTVTGRPRRCGWFDAVAVRQAVKTRRHRRHRADQARRARRLRRGQILHRLPLSAARPMTSFRRARRPRRGSSRSTRAPRAGAKAPAVHAPGPICRRPRSNTSAGSRS